MTTSKPLSPPSKIIPWRPVYPSKLAPLEPPSANTNAYPFLPSRARSGSFYPGYNISTHIFPAAFPRCPSDLLVRPSVSNAAPETKEHVAELVRRLAALKESQEQGNDTRKSRREILWTVANRIVRACTPSGPSGPPGLTLIFLHGIGAHKETWEPIIRQLFASMESSSSSLIINEIWMLDCVQHGDAGLVNEASLGDTFDCAEYARDVTNFILCYLPEDVHDQTLPTNLRRLPDSTTDHRKAHGFSSRTIVGIGHSVGACSFIYPAVEFPALFSSLVLVESMTIPEYIKQMDAHRKYESICLRRRWVWDSRDAAVQDIRRNAYYRTWHPSILDEYIRYAITETDGGKFRMKTHPYLEALMMFERRIVYETWELLAQVNPEMPLHWVWGGKSMRGGGPAIQAQTSYRHPGKNSNDWHPDVDHLFPQEAPEVLAQDVFRFLDARYGSGKSRL